MRSACDRSVRLTNPSRIHRTRLVRKKPPHLHPRRPFVTRLECHHSVRGKIRGCTIDQEDEKPRQVRKVPGDQDVARLGGKPVADPRRRIVRQQAPRGREFRERIAGAPECLRGLTRAQLSAVPDDGRPRASRRGLRRQHLRLALPGGRQRPARVDLRTDGVTVMDQIQLRGAMPFRPPESSAATGFLSGESDTSCTG